MSHDYRSIFVNVRPFAIDYSKEKELAKRSCCGLFVAEEPEVNISNKVEILQYDITKYPFPVLRQFLSAMAITVHSPFLQFFDVGTKDFPFVTFGAEDKSIHVWHREYGIYLGKYSSHKAPINSVVRRVANPELLVSASDDYTIQVWN